MKTMKEDVHKKDGTIFHVYGSEELRLLKWLKRLDLKIQYELPKYQSYSSKNQKKF